MPRLTNQPTNPNFSYQTNFQFQIQRLPNTVYFCQSAPLPGVTLPVVEQSNPMGRILRPAKKMTWEPFEIAFAVDEDFRNYFEIFNWMVAIGYPDDPSQYAEIAKQKFNGVESDATLMILDSMKNPNIRVMFKNLFPIGISRLDFNMKDQQTTTPLECTATFSYERFYVEKLGEAQSDNPPNAWGMPGLSLSV